MSSKKWIQKYDFELLTKSVRPAHRTSRRLSHTMLRCSSYSFHRETSNVGTRIVLVIGCRVWAGRLARHSLAPHFHTGQDTLQSKLARPAPWLTRSRANIQWDPRTPIYSKRDKITKYLSDKYELLDRGFSQIISYRLVGTGMAALSLHVYIDFLKWANAHFKKLGLISNSKRKRKK